MNYSFRKAVIEDAGRIREILQQAIFRRKAEGSQQWQDGEVWFRGSPRKAYEKVLSGSSASS